MGPAAKGPGKKARIEIIPLIDIMFFLLASFMLVSMSMIKLQAIQTNLPSAATSVPIAKPDFVAVGIDSKGAIYFDKEKNQLASAEELPAKLTPLYKDKGEELKVFINADKDTSYNSVVTVLDKIRLMGIKKVSFPVKADNKFDPASRSAAAPAGAPAPAAPAAAPAPAAVAPPAAPPANP